MSDTILVAYATRYGSTEEVAESVVATLREGGLEVDLKPMREVESLDGYRAVILGAPLYIGSWPKDARRLLSRHHEPLMRLPVAVFTLGPTSKDEQDWQGSREQLDRQVARYPSLEPASVELVGGVYDPAKLRFPDSLLAAVPASPLHGMPTSDVRDWEAIRSWASGLAATLGLTSTG
jgi:menaquinone-dependent protoporphyrinogen oxidase